MLYLDCFKNTADNAMVAHGNVNSYGNVVINMSDIYSKLIKEAGHFCDNYASDIIGDINVIQTLMDSKQNGTRYIAFREMGVDGNTYISYRDIEEIPYYRAIYRVDIKFVTNMYGDESCIVTMNKVYYSTDDHKWKEGK